MNELLEKAAQICLEKHKGKTDKAGVAYFLHPMRVAAACTNNDERIVAMLHDTVEDTDVTPEYLLAEGFPRYIVDAILSVTRNEGESYENFIKRCARNPIGRRVKLHDLDDNLNLVRLEAIDGSMVDRLNRYIRAHCYLDDYKDATD